MDLLRYTDITQTLLFIYTHIHVYIHTQWTLRTLELAITTVMLDGVIQFDKEKCEMSCNVKNMTLSGLL